MGAEQSKAIDGVSNRFRLELTLYKDIPAHIETVKYLKGFGGAFGAWGIPIANSDLPWLAERYRGEAIKPDQLVPPEKMTEDFGFSNRYCVPTFISNDEEMARKHIALEIEYAGRLAAAAAAASGFRNDEVEALILSSSMPIASDFTYWAAQEAGFKPNILRGSVHMACAGGTETLRLALTQEVFRGKKIIVGGFEGLGRYSRNVPDAPLQLFGNGAAMLGLIPGVTAKHLASQREAVGDPNNTMAFRQMYHHEGQELLFSSGSFETGDFELAGKMPEPNEGEVVSIKNSLGLVRLFVPNGPAQIDKVIKSAGRLPEVIAVHHMNKKIMEMYERSLTNKFGYKMRLPWLFGEYGNISSASSVLALLKQRVHKGDAVLMHGLGVGGYFSTVMFEAGKKDDF